LELSLEIQILIAPTEAEARARLRQIAALPASPRGRRRDDILAFLDAAASPPTADPPPTRQSDPSGPSFNLQPSTFNLVFDDWLIGTPDDVAARLREYQALGVSHFMLWFVDFPSLDGLRLFAEAVVPRLR
jgi:alkanesulfonate monooxygenase